MSTHIQKEEEAAKLEKVDLEGAQVHFNVNSFLHSATMFLLLNLIGQTLFEYLYHLIVLLHSPTRVCMCVFVCVYVCVHEHYVCNFVLEVCIHPFHEQFGITCHSVYVPSNPEMELTDA